MHKVTDIRTLGDEYTVSDNAGSVLAKVRTIMLDEFIDAGVGLFSDSFASFNDYLTQSRAALSGFDEMDMTAICWYTTSADEPDMASILEYAVVNGYTCVIIELLDKDLV